MSIEMKTSGELAALLSDLHTRKQTAANRIEEIAGEQRNLSVPAATGDAEARAAVARLDEEEVSLTAELRTLQVAIEETGRAQRAAQEREAEERAKQRQAEFEAMREGAIAEAAAVDQAMVDLAARLVLWSVTASRIDRLEVLPASKRGDLASVSAIKSALQSSGLAPLLGLEASSVFGKGPSLAATAERLLKPETKAPVVVEAKPAIDPQESELHMHGWGHAIEAFREARRELPGITVDYFIGQHRQVAVNQSAPNVRVAAGR